MLQIVPYRHDGNLQLRNEELEPRQNPQDDRGRFAYFIRRMGAIIANLARLLTLKERHIEQINQQNIALVNQNGAMLNIVQQQRADNQQLNQQNQVQLAQVNHLAANVNRLRDVNQVLNGQLQQNVIQRNNLAQQLLQRQQAEQLRANTQRQIGELEAELNRLTPAESADKGFVSVAAPVVSATLGCAIGFLCLGFPGGAWGASLGSGVGVMLAKETKTTSTDRIAELEAEIGRLRATL